jgi:hypothetical protein
MSETDKQQISSNYHLEVQPAYAVTSGWPKYTTHFGGLAKIVHDALTESPVDEVSIKLKKIK